MRTRAAVEAVNADELVVGAGRKVEAIGREADGVDGAEMLGDVA